MVHFYNIKPQMPLERLLDVINLHTLNSDFLTASRMVVVWPVIEQWRLISLSSVTSDSTVTPSSVEVATG